MFFRSQIKYKMTNDFTKICIDIQQYFYVNYYLIYLIAMKII